MSPSRSRHFRWLLLLPFLALGLAAVTSADEPAEKPKPKHTEEEDTAPPKGKAARKEEEDTAKGKPKKVIRVEEDDPMPKDKPKATPIASASLPEAAAQAKNDVVKELFLSLAKPYDVVHLHTSDRTPKVVPCPLYLGEGAKIPHEGFKSKEFNAKWETNKESTYHPLKVDPYEEIARAAVKDFLARRLDRVAPSSPRYLSRFDQLLAAEQVLNVVVRFHESAIESGQRKGEGWGAIEAKVREDLLDVLVGQLDALVEAGDWDNAFTLTSRLAATYPGLKEQEKIAVAVTKLQRQALNKGVYTEDKLREIRQRLRDLRDQFPDSEAIRPLTENLRKQAQDLFDRANKYVADKKLDLAQDLLKQAEDADPTLPGLRALRLALSKDHPVLNIGVPEMPVYLSPALAATDIERQCVELLFESLVKLSPDATGALRYRAGLAEGRPLVIDLGRRFFLSRDACWSDGSPLRAGDIRESVTTLKSGHGTGRSPAWGDLLEPVIVGGDPFRVEVHLSRGYIDALAPMTFKVVPTRTVKPDSREFAEAPLGSGPYSYVGIKSLPGGVSFAGFVANPYFGSRASKTGLPRIREIRLFRSTNPLQDFSTGRIDVALNLTVDQYQTLRKNAMANRLVLSRPAATNRRVYFLAVNPKRTGLLDKTEFRQALAHAINREELLDKYFRGGMNRGEVHKAINSPYPAGSWPLDKSLVNTVNKESLDPYDPQLAEAKAVELKSALQAGRLSLKYPTDNPAMEKAMTDLKTQVGKALGFDIINLEGVNSRTLKQDVDAQNFDLAYTYYDFPDDTLWLMPLLGPRGPTGGTNHEVIPLLEKMDKLRDFTEVREIARQLHGVLVKEMPVIPLWQLDPFHAFRDVVKPATFDPHLVFTDAEEWRLERK